jgi:hypothetical protein
MKPRGQMISEEALATGNAFSFSNQPYLKQLFDTVIHDEIPITFVVGAGVSMDASLPSWATLIKRICDQIKDDRFKKLAVDDPADLMRKTEFVLEMVMEDTGRTPEEIVRKALYGEPPVAVTPGPLAEAIVRLGTALGERARLLTTNFDKVIESGLESYLPETEIKSINLKEELGKGTWSNQLQPGIHNVLHVHGMVVAREEPGKPVILSESHFLEYGPKVRQLILDQLKSSCVIFLGVSITDPNLTGPLWDARSPKEGHDGLASRPFVLVVPEPVTSTGCGDREGKIYALKKARYLEQKLEMRPIFLKSHAQLVQVLWDLDLGFAVPGRYETSGQRMHESLAYGNRFKQKLDACYTAIGCNATQDSLSLGKAQRLSASLHAALSKNGDVGYILNTLIRRHNNGALTDENFGLFLWLRIREHDPDKAPYALNLMGSSAYVHRAAWSASKKVPIVADSRFPAARALFCGTMLIGDLKGESPFAIWRGMLAKPIRIEDTTYCKQDFVHGLDTVVVGAVTLNTTKYTERDQHPGIREDELSVLNRMPKPELAELGASLEKATLKILGFS